MPEHEVYINSTPMPHKFSGFAKGFSSSYPCYFSKTDNSSLVTFSLNKCTFPNSQTRFCISMQALLCALPMSKNLDSFHVFREAAAVSGCQKEGRCVLVSTLERDTVLSTFLATAGSRQGGWLSSPFSLCSIQPMWIRGLFINSKDFCGLKTTRSARSFSGRKPRGHLRHLQSRRSTVVPLNAFPGRLCFHGRLHLLPALPRLNGVVPSLSGSCHALEVRDLGC